MELLDYIKWRGDLTFEERELNEIDSILFSMLSYEQFDEILLENTSLSLNDTAKLFFSKYDETQLKNRISFTNRSYEVLKAMQNTKRYGSLVLSNYVNEIDIEQDLQFSALTIEYKNKWIYVVYRGTDDTFTGWKEDFSMIYKNEVLSQQKAVRYMIDVTQQISLFKKRTIYVGGHSKGGNLAIYACANVSSRIQKRIKRIDNFDGPGFERHVWDKSSMKKILPFIHTYIPQDSFFGRMFIHKEKVKIIKSKASGLLQHHPFNWCVDVDRFVYEEDLSQKSDTNIEKLNDLLESLNHEERKELVESLFTIFEHLSIHTFTDIAKINVNTAIKILIELNGLSGNTKKHLREVLKIFFNASL